MQRERMMFDEDESLEERLRFMQKVVPADDVYEFCDLLFQMNFVLANALHEYTNMETVIEQNFIVKKTLQNLVEFRLKMKHKDIRLLQLEKYDLSDYEN